MELELQIVIQEEKYLQEEGPRVSEAVDSCTKLSQTLEVLMQFATVQLHRTPLVPYFSTTQTPNRNALLENIQAVIPNHTHRMECLKRAETLFHKKKQLHSPLKAKLREFETQLRVQRDHLRHIEVTTVEKQQELKWRANFMEEKYKMEKEIAKELETERKLALQKREQRKKQMEELWHWQQRSKVDEEKSRQKQSLQRVMEGVAGSTSGSNRSIPTSSDGSGHHIRSSSDDRSLVSHPSLSQSSDQPQSQLIPPPKGKRFRKKDHLQPWQRKSIGYVGEFNELFTTIADEVKTSNQASHPLTTSAKPSNHIAAQRSHDKVPTNQIDPSKHREQWSNQIAVPPTVKATLGPKIEVKEVTSNLRPQQLQTTPPFKHPSKQSRPTKTIGQFRPSPPTSKSNAVPSRYLQYEHSSQPDTDSVSSYPSKKGSYKSSVNSLSQPNGDEPLQSSHMQPMLPLLEAHKKRATIGGTRFRGQASNYPQPMKRSNSDDSLYESSTLERRKKQGLAGTPYKAKQKGDLSPAHNRKWAMSILNKDTLPVEYRQAQFDSRHANRGRVRNTSASSGDSGGQSAKAVGQRYPYHMPKNRSDPQQRHAPNCPAHSHNNLPLRATRSAQVPSDSPLTSYPRHLASTNHALQMRSASNGMPAQRGGRGTHYPGNVTSERSHVTQHRRKVDDEFLGSLV